ncbi:TPA: hypothetical protein ACH98V_002752, partial [Staphylococcus aureus]|nr:hypothetical protein [Staphylococcus aureus]
YIEKGQHAQTCYPNEPVKKTVTILD